MKKNKQKQKEKGDNTMYGRYKIILRNQHCMDCGTKDPLLFMVKKNLWKEIMGDYHAGVICIKCFCNRLGRKIKLNELKSLMGNSTNLYYLKDYLTEIENVEYFRATCNFIRTLMRVLDARFPIEKGGE